MEPPTSSNQLDAIETLRTLYEKWKLLAPPALLNESHAVHILCASPPPSACSLPNTTPAPIVPTTLFMPWKMMTTMTHLVPPHGHHPCYWHWCCKHQVNLHKSLLSNRPHPRGLSLMKLLLQVCPLQPHNRANRHFQGYPKHQALSLIAKGHVLRHRDSVHLWNWCNTIFSLPKKHGHKTPWPPNLSAYAKHWGYLNLR
jgi:hypothetical protein